MAESDTVTNNATCSHNNFYLIITTFKNSKSKNQNSDTMFGKPSNEGVKINCRKCGQPSDSTKFVLDPVYKMMVCPKCAQERKTSASLGRRNASSASTVSASNPMVSATPPQSSPNSVNRRAPATQLGAASHNRAAMEARISPSTQKPKEQEPPKPAGWDEDDIELERLAKHKSNENAPKVERISDDKLKMTCAKCKYRFTYNIDTQTPTSCPYCGREIDKPRSY